jgi:hypothetical protein
MRSVLVHLAGCTEAEVASLIASTYPAQAGPPWIDLVDGDPCLYIDHYRDHVVELEPADLDQLKERFSGRLPVSLIANVSGRHNGAEQVHHFVEALLTCWSGVAQDNYSDHLWTLPEIRAGTAIEGRLFFREHG